MPDYLSNVDWNLIISVILSGFVIVFVVLIGLTFFIFLIGKTMNLFSKKPKEIKPKQPKQIKQKPIKKQESNENSPVIIKPQAIDSGIPSDVIVAISAAVAVFMGDKKFKVKSIKKQNNQRLSWNMAGILENTKPF